MAEHGEAWGTTGNHSAAWGTRCEGRGEFRKAGARSADGTLGHDEVLECGASRRWGEVKRGEETCKGGSPYTVGVVPNVL